MVETPQLAHATYVFTKPRSMEGFLPCIRGLPRKTFGGIGTTSVTGWNLWGVSFTAHTPELGSKKFGSVSARGWTSSRRLPTDLCACRPLDVSNCAIGEILAKII